MNRLLSRMLAVLAIACFAGLVGCAEKSDEDKASDAMSDAADAAASQADDAADAVGDAADAAGDALGGGG